MNRYRFIHGKHYYRIIHFDHDQEVAMYVERPANLAWKLVILASIGILVICIFAL